MARAPRGCWAARRRRAEERLRRGGSAHSAASRNHNHHPHGQGCTWTGVRGRGQGRWAAQIRVPGTRTRLWIGRFDLALQAALAYDTALFCFYGAGRLPNLRRFNFPAAPRPRIPEDVRAMLTLTDIKAIAHSHARALATFFVGPLPAAVSPAASAAPAAAVADEATATSNGNNFMG